jgi:serine protease AprX
VGVAPEALLLVAKVLRNDGSGFMSDVMSGIDWAVDQGAQVINLSLGSDGACDGTDALSVTCDAAVARGIVLCVAAGNAGPGPRTVGSPGCARNVITVGASTDNDAIASFSSRGPTLDGRVKPDIVFPGQNIVAARAKGTSMGTPQGEFYTSASGTSMATPHCSGAVALLLAAEPSLTPAQVKQRLMSTAVNLGLDSNSQGAGRADVYAAVHPSVPVPEPTPTPEPTPAPNPPGCLEAILRLFRPSRP